MIPAIPRWGLAAWVGTGHVIHYFVPRADAGAIAFLATAAMVGIWVAVTGYQMKSQERARLRGPEAEQDLLEARRQLSEWWVGALSSPGMTYTWWALFGAYALLLLQDMWRAPGAF